MEDQARLVSALAVVHNFIRVHDPNYLIIEASSNGKGNDTEDAEDQDTVLRRDEQVIPAEEQGRAAERRDRIARAMWRDYKK